MMQAHTLPQANPAPGLTRGLPHHPEAPDQVRGGVSHTKGATA
jgi:hypothetical protein